MVPEIIKIAADADYDGIEVRFVTGADLLWELRYFNVANSNQQSATSTERGLVTSGVDPG